MKIRLRIVLLSVGLGLVVWIIHAILDALVFYNGTFMDLLILHVSPHELYIRLIILAIFVTFGLLVSGLLTERASAESALQESQRTLETLMGNLPGMAYRCQNDEKWTMTFVSKGGLDLTGYRPADLIDNRAVAYADLIVPEDREAVWKAVQAGVRSGEPYQMVYRITTADGAQKWVWEQGEAIPSPCDDGEILLEGFITDITERVKTEGALRASEGRSRTTLYSIGDAVITTDSQGRVQQMNPVAEALTGWREAEAAGKPLPEVFHIINETTRAKIASPVERVLKAGATAGLANHTLLIARDGKEYLIADSGAPIRNEEGELTGVVLVFRDQTKERAAERALRESEEKYRSLFENMLSGCAYHRIVLDENGLPVDFVFLDINEAFEQQTGRGREEVIGKRVTELIPGVEEGDLIRLCGQVALTGEPARFENYEEALDSWYWVSAYSPQPEHFVTIFHDITERKQAEEALQTSEQRYRVLAENAPLGIWQINPEGYTLYANPAMCSMLQVESYEELWDVHVSAFVSDEDYRKGQREVRKRGGGVVSEYVIELNGREGRKRMVHITGAPIFTPSGELHSSMGLVIDITERLQTEEALQASERRYRALAENAPVGIWQLDPEGHTLYANPAMYALAQVDSSEDPTGVHFSEFFSEESLRKVQMEFARRREGTASRYEVEMVGREGRKRQVLISGAPIFTPDGELHSAMGLIIDITERLQTEEALQASEERYRALAENAPTGLWQLDPEGHTLYANPAMCALAQVDTPEDLVGVHFSEFFSEESLRKVQGELARRREGIASRYEVELIGREGRKRKVIISGAPIFSPDGTLHSALGLIIDITEREQAEEALRQSEARLAAFTDAMPDAGFILDGDGKYLEVMGGRKDLLADRITRLKGRYIHDVLPQDVVDKCLAAIRQALATGEVQSVEYSLDVSAGHRQFEGRTLPTGTDIVGTDAVVFVARDITERKQTEEALRKSAIIIGSTTDATVTTDLEGRITFWNMGAENIFGYKREEALGKHVSILYREEDLPVLNTSIAELMAGNDISNLELTTVDKYGNDVHILLSLTSIRGEDGDITELVGISKDITERIRVQEAERQQRLLAEALRDTAAMLHSTLELDEVLDRILEAAEELVPHRGANIMLLSESGEEFNVRYCSCYETNDLLKPQPAEGAPLTTQGLYPSVVRTHEPVIVPDTREDPAWPTDIPSIQWVRSYLCAPILVDGEIAGFINVDSTEVDKFTPDDAKALEALATQAAAAIDSAQLFERVRRQAQYLASLNQASSRVSRWGLDLDGVLQAVVTTLTEEIGVDFARIWLADKEGESLEIRASAGWREEPGVDGMNDITPDRTGRLAQITQEGKPFLTNRVQEDETFDREWAAEHGIVAFAGYPLTKDRRLMAVLTIFHTKPLSETVLDVMGSFVNQAAIAIENARLYDELETYSGILEQAVAERTADLERAKEQVESILHHSPDGIVLLTPNGVIETTNPATQAMLGYSEDELSGQPTNMLVEPSYASRCDAAQENVRLENATQKVELLIRRKDGTTFDAQAVLGPMLEGNTLLGIVCSLRDITALKEIERIKDDFLATAAHELRTPLTSIRGFSELLLTRDLSRDRQERYHRHINDQSTQLANIIDDLLDISRLEAGRELDLKLAPVHMSALIEEIVGPFVETMPEYTFRLNIGQDDPVMGDAFRLSQVVRNLVLNAVKYSSEGGEVAIETRVRDTRLEVSVTDQGIGITEQQKVHLFEKFYRADPSGSSGTGLGLVICKLIVEGHGGEICVESQPGEGSTFTFTVPLAV